MATIKRRYTLRLQDETFEKVAYIANKEKRSVRIPKIVSYGMLADLFYGLFLGKTNRGFLHGLRK